MTDQITPLKTKAKTPVEINNILLSKCPRRGYGISDNEVNWSEYSNFALTKYVLLSDVEPLELEIQQLKGRINELAIDSGVMCYDYEKCRVPLLEKQIETAKQIWLNQIWRNRLCNGFCAECKDEDGICKDRKEYDEVFGEKTET